MTFTISGESPPLSLPCHEVGEPLDAWWFHRTWEREGEGGREGRGGSGGLMKFVSASSSPWCLVYALLAVNTPAVIDLAGPERFTPQPRQDRAEG